MTALTNRFFAPLGRQTRFRNERLMPPTTKIAKSREGRLTAVKTPSYHHHKPLNAAQIFWVSLDSLPTDLCLPSTSLREPQNLLKWSALSSRLSSKHNPIDVLTAAKTSREINTGTGSGLESGLCPSS